LWYTIIRKRKERRRPQQYGWQATRISGRLLRKRLPLFPEKNKKNA